jgi:hypothetical protein
MFGSGQVGHLNGRIARQQQLARAAGPLAIAWLAGRAGYGTVFMVLAGTFAIVALATPAVLSSSEGLGLEKDTL